MKYIVIIFENGDQFKIPLNLVFESRCQYYAQNDRITIEECRENEKWTLDDKFELLDWVRNNMNWSDVEPHATKIVNEKPYNYGEEFCNAEMQITDKVR